MIKVLRTSVLAAIVGSLALTTACADQGNKHSGQFQSHNDGPNRYQQMGGGPSPLGTEQVNPNRRFEQTGTFQGPGRNGHLGNNQMQTGQSPMDMSGNTGGGFTAQAARQGQGQTIGSQPNIDGTLPVRRSGKEDYVQASKLMELIGFRTDWDANNKVLKFGDNDAAFECRIDSKQARRDEDRFQLKSAPIMLDGVPYLPVSAIGDLLTDEVSFSKEGDTLVFKPSPEQVNLKVGEDGPLPQGNILDFGEDPNDPFKNMKVEDKASSALPESELEALEAVPAAVALKDINIPALITRARKYLGVPYKFGAAPYAQSGRFDCSSYTQYLFGKYGVTLPRTARAQAQLGNSVSRTSLRRGDMLYFYVPGRFQSNKTVGHVGIYIGDMKFIHSSPQPEDGVQITSLNKAYWKQTFLYAKRIVK